MSTSFLGHAGPRSGWALSLRSLLFFWFAAPAALPGAPAAPVAGSVVGGVSVARSNHRGWTDSLALSNGLVEAVVVPAVGRVMQFRFVGEEGVFWENPTLPGRPAPFLAGHFDPKKFQSAEWLNLGGDKSWPAPEADWPEFTGRHSWCPPPAFDGMPWQARVEGSEVEMVSPADPCYGLRVRRRVRFEPGQPVMTVVTRFERVSGAPARIGIWTVTQLREPAAVVVPRVRGSALAEGHVLLGPNQRPPSLRVGPEFLVLRRDARAGYKIGSDAGALLWLGEKHACRIDSPRIVGADYPDKGSSAEVWTNPDPLPYVELEMLGPLRALGPGETLSQTNRYTLLRRVAADPAAEAARIFAP